jgi:hypothetical protein
VLVPDPPAFDRFSRNQSNTIKRHAPASFGQSTANPQINPPQLRQQPADREKRKNSRSIKAREVTA